MRSVWNGSVSFGLVNVPVKLYGATEDHDLKANQIHAHDGGKINYRKVCSVCDTTVGAADMAKRYEVDGQVAVLTDDDLATLPSETDKALKVLEFVPAGSIDPLMFDKPYYLHPDGSVKAYTLFAEILKSTGQVAIARFALRSKTRLAVLGVTGKQDMIVAHTLRWADEVREPHAPVLDNRPDVSEAELKAGLMLIGEMSNEWNPDRYRDTSREELRELVLSRAQDGPLSESPEARAEVSDLLDKLEASVAARTADKPVHQCRPVAARPKLAEIRVWARANGHPDLGDRGRIPGDIVDRYNREVVTA